MSKKWKCLSSLENKNNYVGIDFKQDEINIYFPLGYQIPNSIDKQKNSILELLKTISLCREIDEFSSKSSKKGENEEIPVDSYLWLINDYLNNGLFNIYEKRYHVDQKGKINWKRTLKTKSYCNENGVVYLNPIVESKKSVENIITDIEIYCLNESNRIIGWLFGDIICPNNRVEITSDNADYYISILNKEYVNSFDDKKKTLLHHMIKIITNLSGKNETEKIRNILTYNYYHAFEKMVDKVYSNSNIKKYLPNSNWIINQIPKKNSDLRPDTIIECLDKLYILDSKYYKYGIDNKDYNLPSTTSVEKQITYGEYAKNKGGFKEVYNAFIIPYNKNCNDFNRNGNIEYCGFATSNWKKGNLEYENISLILIDMNYLFDCYFDRERKNIELLTSSIEKVINDKEEYFRKNSINLV